MKTKSASSTAPAQPLKGLSEMELEALSILKRHGGCVLVTAIADKTEKGMFGERVPGSPIYKKLDKAGLVNLTEEDVEEDGFQFTPMVELTALGEAVWREATGHPPAVLRSAART